MTPRWIVGLLLLALAATLCVGCTDASTKIDGQTRNVDLKSTPANVGTVEPDGGIVAAYHGLGGTAMNIDEAGSYMATPGDGGWMVYNPQTGTIVLWSPKDSVMKGVKFTPAPEPGQPALSADEITMNISVPREQLVAGLAEVIEAIIALPKDQAEAKVKELEAAGEITSDIANLLLTYVVPMLAG